MSLPIFPTEEETLVLQGMVALALSKRICRNCRHWDPGNPDKMEGARYRCYEPHLYGWISDEENVAAAHDDGYDTEGITTGPNFGCIHFDPK